MRESGAEVFGKQLVPDSEDSVVSYSCLTPPSNGRL